ncbi:hypothetical protein ABT121_28210 [Streptomyces sp. NPDC001928]|uniref:hypothetical protein n=1 Tax=Streptomyces sp. NPDC001928 TaxID=3154404 RepID=UPI003318365C
MSTASTARCRSRSRAGLRVLVLLLALLVPGAHAQAHALPTVAGAAEVAEHDILDTALRPPARADRRHAVRTRPAPPLQQAAGAAPGSRPTAPTGPPYVPHILRTVVLRC